MARNIDPKPEVEEKCNEMSDLENKCFTAKDLFIYFKVPEPRLVYGTVHYKNVDIILYRCFTCK
jgi:hypothetical protein